MESVWVLGNDIGNILEMWKVSGIFERMCEIFEMWKVCGNCERM